ncbi:hypothetical protein F3J38_18995 [Pantoea sp. Acro-805]|uniref:Phage protein n=1 Tax=Candidatus Pantoea formicae TaxID=2608355 RepID=A0ABX0R2E6_9GAMM|nr:hypothetical protein [Pantoea formicae]NIF02123.1 hypothetical protein [Pantoea formicae]
MNLPARKYYPITEAAKRMQCQESDVLHLIAIGELDAYVFMNNFKLDDGKLMHLNMTEELVRRIDCFSSITGEQWSVYDIKKINNYDAIISSGYYAGTIDGLFYVDGLYLSPLEFGDDEIFVQQLSSERDLGGGDYPLDINFLRGEVTIEKRKICILEKDISSMSRREATESNKTIAKKAEIIPQLIKLIPEFNDVDVDETPAEKVVALVESIAASRGVEMPQMHIQTWRRYLGRK